jgi:hypothetical protein
LRSRYGGVGELVRLGQQPAVHVDRCGDRLVAEPSLITGSGTFRAISQAACECLRS